jgi:hypothetical protein
MPKKAKRSAPKTAERSQVEEGLEAKKEAERQPGREGDSRRAHCRQKDELAH